MLTSITSLIDIHTSLAMLISDVWMLTNWQQVDSLAQCQLLITSGAVCIYRGVSTRFDGAAVQNRNVMAKTK